MAPSEPAYPAPVPGEQIPREPTWPPCAPVCPKLLPREKLSPTGHPWRIFQELKPKTAGMEGAMSPRRALSGADITTTWEIRSFLRRALQVHKRIPRPGNVRPTLEG